jgi:hypothetical protein
VITMIRHFICLLFLLLSQSFAQPPIEIIHTEKLQAGPYQLEIGFSRWPVQAGRSLDIVFSVEGGVEDKIGTLTLVTANPQTLNRQKKTNQPFPLERHPRMREAWGLDEFAFPSDGQWTFDIAVDGPQGEGKGSLAVMLLEPPKFLPHPVNWVIAFLPLIALLVITVMVWQRDKPNRQADTWSWS